eukprot:6181526-Pleurochrysis_carterae.AAC.1
MRNRVAQAQLKSRRSAVGSASVARRCRVSTAPLLLPGALTLRTRSSACPPWGAPFAAPLG